MDYFAFSKEDAEQYGVEAAVMLHHVRYWVAKNEANDKNFFEEKYWTFNSTTAFSKLFPFWSARKIGRLLTKLEEEGAIISSRFNKQKYDRTKWYTLGNAITEIGITHSSDPVNGMTVFEQPIPNNKQSTTTINNIIYPFDTIEFKDRWKLWKQYKKEQHKFSYKSKVSEQAALKRLSELSNQDEGTAKELINYAIAQGWKGFYKPDKTRGTKNFDAEKFSSYIESL